MIMKSGSCTFSLFVSLLLFMKVSTERKTVEDYMNQCFDSRGHKISPSPEPDLYGECAPWSEMACCLLNRTQSFHQQEIWEGFNYNHCPNNPISEKCRRRMMQNYCFHECSPNTGPWIQSDKRKWRSERYVKLPLCRSMCNNWWEDCKNGYTCRDNWSKGFNFTTGTSECPAGSECRPFTEVWTSASEFCEKLWDYEYLIVDDDQPCMTFVFNETNPNTAVARWRAQQLVNNGSKVNANLAILFAITVTASYIQLNDV